MEDEYELVELIETVVQDAEKFVKGAADETSDTTVVSQSVERKDKDGAAFKQYINLDPLVEGQAKRHPEYGRIIRFRARVKQKNGKTDKLSGVKVVFKRERVDGPRRTDPGGEPAIFSVPALTAAQQDGFGGPGGGAETSSVTDANGWTSVVELHLSEFAGDQFKVSCQLDAAVKGAAGSSPKKTKANYVVYRRFWYQMTYADGYAAQRPTTAEAAYAEVFAEMVLASEKKFQKTDLPADLQDRTFMPEYQLKQGGGNGIVANVGDNSNIGEFSTNAKMNLDVKPEHPVKGNLIICEYQCDPQGTSQLKKYKLTANGQTITIARGTGGPIISKPAIKAGANVVVSGGEWSTTDSPWNKGGDITDVNIEIAAARASTLAVKINLPAGAPTPTAANPVWVRLQLETAKNFLGWATAGGIVAVYQPSAPAGSQGSLVDFNDTTSHEFGHKFRQTPVPASQPASLKNHPLQYVGHGGSGPHCRHAATVTAGPVNWQNASQETPSPQDGDCNMYHRYSTSCSHKFCIVCKTYLQLEKMRSL